MTTQEPTPTVGRLAHAPIRDIRLTATLRQAAEELSEEQVGALVVRDHRGVMGIVTEFDLARALGEGADPDEDRVRVHMSDRVVTIRDDGELAEAARLMHDHEIRHLLVVDDADEPVGVISARDLLGAMGPAAAPA